MTGQELLNILEAADVRITEASQLFRVGKSTIYRWGAGGGIKQPMAYDFAVKLTEFIRDAHEAGYLPLKDMRGKARLGGIKAAIKRVAEDRLLTKP